MFPLYAALVRTGYCLAVLTALACYLPFVPDQVRGVLVRDRFYSPGASAWLSLIAALVLVLFALRAVIRLIRTHDLIRDSQLREAPVTATFVWMTSVLAVFFLLNTGWAFLERAGRDIELAPGIFFGTIFMAIALLAGELALIGRGPATGRATNR